LERKHIRGAMVIEMYEVKKEYKVKGEIKYHLPEWIRILKDYFKENYDKNCLVKSARQKNKKKGVEDLL